MLSFTFCILSNPILIFYLYFHSFLIFFIELRFRYPTPKILFAFRSIVVLSTFAKNRQAVNQGRNYGYTYIARFNFSSQWGYATKETNWFSYFKLVLKSFQDHSEHSDKLLWSFQLWNKFEIYVFSINVVINQITSPFYPLLKAFFTTNVYSSELEPRTFYVLGGHDNHCITEMDKYSKKWII